ncbi:MAG: LacI family DNA-binding transcriptional regulator [Kiritimatiellae bacterium]|nr:LacI family DNA-binding transcriptional regulator [Kiritimatiellia bacterium]
MNECVTLKDIARSTGFSVPTVSQALNGTGRISRATREKIMRGARELRYRPNAAARTMRRGRFGNATVLYPPRDSYLPQELLRGLLRSLTAHDLNMQVANIGSDAIVGEGDLPRLLDELSTDGLLVNFNAPLPEQTVEFLASYSVPAVWINNKMPADCVYPDDLGATREATQYLVELGHRRIGYLCFRGGRHYSLADRQAGYEQAMQAAGLPLRLHAMPLDYPTMLSRKDNRTALLREWLSAADRPTGFVTYGHDSALPLATAALQLGFRIPENLSIVTVYPSLLALSGIPITTMQGVWNEVGERAVEMLLRKMEEPGTPLPPCACAYTLRKGRSCAEPGPA